MINYYDIDFISLNIIFLIRRNNKIINIIKSISPNLPVSKKEKLNTLLEFLIVVNCKLEILSFVIQTKENEI